MNPNEKAAKLERHLLKTQFPLECQELPFNALTQDELIVVNKCMSQQDLTDDEFTLLKATLQKYRKYITQYQPSETIEAMEKTVELLDKSLIDLENLYNITENSVKVGAVEQTTADQIKVQVASMRSAINSTNRSLEMIYNALALQLAAGADVKFFCSCF